MGFIYKIINITNNDIYIGQTKKNIKRRFNAHLYNAKNTKNLNNKFYNAINKYGKENFKIEMLKEVSDDLLDFEEIFFIKQLNPKYNTSEGGKSTKGFLGKILSSEHKKALNNSNIKEVFQYNFNGEFLNKYKSLSEAGKQTGCNPKTISHCIRKIQFSSCSFLWYDSYQGKKVKKYTKVSHRRLKINQYDLNDNFIKTWDSMMEIEKELNINAGKICACCKNLRKSTKGFKFKYYKNEKHS